jgi:hypothetical protein
MRNVFVGLAFILVVAPFPTGRFPQKELAVPCSPAGSLSIRSDSISIQEDEARDVVFVRGRWKVTSDPDRNALPVVNTVDVTCQKETRTCREVIAGVYSNLDAANLKTASSWLTIFSMNFEIIRWTDSTVQAVARPSAADIDILISLEHKTAERTARETGTRGAKGASAVPEKWMLE